MEKNMKQWITIKKDQTIKYVYHKDNLLGEGKFAKVYKGYLYEKSKDLNVNPLIKAVAVKVISIDDLKIKLNEDKEYNHAKLSMEDIVSRNDKEFTRLKNNKEILSSDPNLSKVYDIYHSENEYITIMELFSEGTLEDYLKEMRKNDKEIPVEECMEIIEDVIKACRWL